MSAGRKRATAAPSAKASEAKAISRRRFVSLLAAGSAAVIARPADAAPPARRARRPVTPPAAPAPSAAEKEFERQRANTISTVKLIRDYKLPPGGDLSVVFRPLPSARQRRS